MHDGGEHEAFLTADYNAEMIEHIARLPATSATARSSSATLTTSSPTRFGPELPPIRDWTEAHYDFAGYVTGLRPGRLRRPRGAARRARVPPRRAGLHRHASAAPGVGGHLLRRVIDGVPGGEASACPALRMIVVAGPRIDPAYACPQATGSRSGRYVHDLYRHLAACDLAVVQGGLTTSMELDGEPAPVPLLPAAPPLRAELPRAPPARSATAPVAAWTSRRRRRRRSQRRSPRRSGARSTTGRSRPTAQRSGGADPQRAALRQNGRLHRCRRAG